MLVYPTATLGAGPSNPKATRSAVLSLNRGFRRNSASPRCVSLVRRPFLCPLTINPTQQACHLNHFIVLDLDVAKQTPILRHYSVGNRGREISHHIFQGCFWSHQKYCKNLLRAILARTYVIPSRSTRSWGSITAPEAKRRVKAKYIFKDIQFNDWEITWARPKVNWAIVQSHQVI